MWLQIFILGGGVMGEGEKTSTIAGFVKTSNSGKEKTEAIKGLTRSG
jgi:hypothetical protein